MIDYRELKKKFPSKLTERQKNLKLKAIAREYELKKLELGGKAPIMKRGILYYSVVILGMLLVGSLVLSATGKGGRKVTPKAIALAQKSVDALAEACGRYRFHVGRYPTTAEGLAELASNRVKKPGWNGPYVRQIVEDPWKHDYEYVGNGESEPPTLYSKGPDGIAGTPDDIVPSDKSLFEKPFTDQSWTREWMPYQLRGINLVKNEHEKELVRKAVEREMAAKIVTGGSETLCDEWTFTDGKFRRSLFLGERFKDRAVMLRFDVAGVELELDGNPVEPREAPGYGVEFDLTDLVKLGSEMTLAVKMPEGTDAAVAFGTVRDAELVIDSKELRGLWGSRELPRPVAPESLRCVVLDLGPGTAAAASVRESYRRMLAPLKDLGANAVALPGGERNAALVEVADDSGLVLMDAVPEDAVKYSSVLDLAGERAGEYYRVRAGWNQGAMTLHLSDEWSRVHSEGEQVEVFCDTSADAVELHLDGRSLGRREVGESKRVSWLVPYEEAGLKAIAFKGEGVVGETAAEPIAEATAVKLECDLKEVRDYQVAFVEISLVDDDGELVRADGVEVMLSIGGPGEIVALGNGGEKPRLMDDSMSVQTCGGRALAAIRRGGNSGQPIRIEALALGLRRTALTLLRKGGE